MLGTRKRIATYKGMADFLHTPGTVKKATIGIVKSMLKIPLRHNSIVPIKIKCHSITGHTAYFISHQDSTERKDPNKKHCKWHSQH